MIRVRRWRPVAVLGWLGLIVCWIGANVSHRTFRDRRHAGRCLAPLLADYRGRQDVVVLALPRGGVPVAYEVALALGAGLDVLLVRKLGVPGQEELAMGAIASGGAMVVNDRLVRELQIPPEVVEQVVTREQTELVRRADAYRAGRVQLDVSGRVVVVVDDGVATGASLRAALDALVPLQPKRVVVAVPVAPAGTMTMIDVLADEVVCASTPSSFGSVGGSYDDFTQVSDDEVRRLLAAARP